MSDSTDAIMASNSRFMDAFNSGDAEGVASLNTDEGQILATGKDVIVCR